MAILEVCAGSLESARAAAEGGAARIELCACLEKDGLTPDLETIKAARMIPGLKVHVLIRPREGNFVYDEAETCLMEEQIRLARDLGADGVVFGALTPEGNIDLDVCRRLAAAANPGCNETPANRNHQDATPGEHLTANPGHDMTPTNGEQQGTDSECHLTANTGHQTSATREYQTSADKLIQTTFHRAFDYAAEPFQALEDVISLGCTRLLTSGQAPKALQGVTLIASLVVRAAGRIIIMPGSGVNPSNAAQILRLTGCTEIHSSARAKTPLTEAPLAETPHTEAPLTETPLAEAPLTEAPHTETPHTETPLTRATYDGTDPVVVAAIIKEINRN